MLKEIIAAFAEYYYITIVFVIFLIAAVFVWIKAISASKKKGIRRDAVLARLREENELCKEFSELTAEKAQSAEPKRLLKGVALNIQRDLEKREDMNSAFLKMSEQKRFIYALDFVFCEDAESLSDFFRKNGKPLTTTADEAVSRIISGDFYAVFNKGYRMFDDDDEELSTVPDDVSTLDSEYSAVLERGKGELFSAVKKYICDNVDFFNTKEMY